MNEPNEQQPSEIWSRWRERRARRTNPRAARNTERAADAPTPDHSPSPAASPDVPSPPPGPRPPGARSPVGPDEGGPRADPRESGPSARPDEGDPGGRRRDPGFGEGAGFERGSRFSAGSGPEPGAPPASVPGAGAGGTEHECLEWCPICRTADVVRASFPPELRDQWQDVQREALTTLRAMIDHYLQRIEREPASSRVEDIPIR